MSMKRRLLALALAFSAVAGACAGCGSKTEDSSQTEGSTSAVSTSQTQDEVATVKVCIPNYTAPADTPAVTEAINAIMEPEYGVRIELEFIATGNWSQQTNLMLTSDEVDVLALYGTPFSSFVNNGQLLDLTEYWENAGEEIKAEWSDEELKPFISGGRLYAIPNFRDYGATFGAVVDETIAAEFGLEEGQFLSWEEFDQFLHDAKEKYPDRYGLVPSGGTALISNWTWDGLGDTKFIGVLPECGQGSTEVMDLFDTEDFKNFTSWARKWYEDGITLPDILSNTESWKSMFQTGKAIACISTAGMNPGTINVHLEPNFIGTDVYQQVSFGINANSGNPDAAWKALEALYTNKEIGTLLVNGIEGQNYVLNEDGTASYPEGVDASTAGYNLVEAYWFVPYCPNSIPAQANGTEFYETLVNQKKEAALSKGFGFAFDSMPVVDEYTACANVMDKYYKALMSGAVDVESTVEQAREELKAAGIDKVISEKQSQFNAWLAEQK